MRKLRLGFAMVVSMRGAALAATIALSSCGAGKTSGSAPRTEEAKTSAEAGSSTQPDATSPASVVSPAREEKREPPTTIPPTKPPPPLPGATPSSELLTTTSGLEYYELGVGTGEVTATPSARVRIHYTGWLESGRRFDSSRESDSPVELALSETLAFWREGVASMKIGGKRKLIVPPELGFGARGRPSKGIPPHAKLIFDVELLDVVELVE